MGLFCSESVSVPKPEPHFFNFLHKTDQTSPEKSRGFWGLRLAFFSLCGGASTLWRIAHARQYLISLASLGSTPFGSKVLAKNFQKYYSAYLSTWS